MKAVHLDTVRLFLHVLAATVWVGGQLTVAGLLPALRTLGVAAPRTVARAFNRIAWPAFAVLIGTGVWNVTVVHAEDHGSYRTTLIAKLALVAVSGLAAWLHTRAQRRAAAAVLGAITGLAALGALFLGVLLSS